MPPDSLDKKKEFSSEDDELFRLLVTSVQDYAILTLDPEGHVVTWNLGAERIKGYKASEIMGHHFSRFYRKEDVDGGKPAAELRGATENGRFEDEGWRVRKDGSLFWANVIITALWDAPDRLRGFAKVTRDLTERRHMEEQLRELNGTLEEKVRTRTEELAVIAVQLQGALKSRDEFLSIASHELKTPLTPLNIHMQTLIRLCERRSLHKISSDTLQEVVQTCSSQLDHLNTLIEALLDFSRVKNGHLNLRVEEFDLSELAQEVGDRFRGQLSALQRSIEIDVGPSVKGRWDRLRIEQVIANLVTNAIRYGGSRPIRLKVWTQGNSAFFSLQDFGIGIRPEDQERIFQRFERAVGSNHFGGLGLGLFIAREIVQAHGGHIAVESKPNMGSVFTVELPKTSPLGAA